MQVNVQLKVKRTAAVAASAVALAGLAYGVSALTHQEQSGQAGNPPAAHHGQGRSGQGNVPSAAGNPAAPRAEVGVCGDARRIGGAVDLKAEGRTIAVLEQFHSSSCDETYAHLTVERSYRESAKRYNVTLGVFLPPVDHPPSAEQGDNLFGQDWEQATQREFWFKHASKDRCAKVDASVQAAYGEPIRDADTPDPQGCRV